MTSPIVKDADPPLATIITDADPVLAQCHVGDFYSVDYTDDYFIDWCAVNVEGDPTLTPVSIEADPPLVDYGIFDIGLFDYPLFDTGEVSIDDDPPPVAIMVEAEP